MEAGHRFVLDLEALMNCYMPPGIRHCQHRSNLGALFTSARAVGGGLCGGKSIQVQSSPPDHWETENRATLPQHRFWAGLAGLRDFTLSEHADASHTPGNK